MDVPLTFADFAVTEARFRKQFRTVPRDAWNDNMVPLAEFLELAAEDREGKFPYIWAVDKKNRLIRVIPAEPHRAVVRGPAEFLADAEIAGRPCVRRWMSRNRRTGRARNLRRRWRRKLMKMVGRR